MEFATVADVPVRGAVLKWARDERGLSLAAAAELLAVEENYLAKLEGGELNPNVGLLREMAQKYEIGFLTPTCGDANESGFYEATDALRALHAALGLARCEMCLCDVDGSAGIAATDALGLLQTAVGAGPALSCPACPP